MMELPLFPLNTVLYPTMPLKLHIFEDRYKLMLNECIEAQKPFGVVLIEDGDEALGALAQPHLIGTTAYITQVQKLPFGRMNILAIGKDRFRVNSLHQDRPYLWGMVDLIPMIEDDTTFLQQNHRLLRPLLLRYLSALSEVGFQFDASQMPDEPLSLSYLAAIVLQAEANQKQDILESINTSHLMKKLVGFYKREVALLDVLMSPPQQEESNQSPFSTN